MNITTVLMTHPFDPDGILSFEFEAHAGYGTTAELAHELLVLCVTVAEKPVLIAADGAVHYVPRELVRAIVTRSLPT